MRVKELIQELQRLDPQAIVTIQISEQSFFFRAKEKILVAPIELIFQEAAITFKDPGRVDDESVIVRIQGSHFYSNYR